MKFALQGFYSYEPPPRTRPEQTAARRALIRELGDDFQRADETIPSTRQMRELLVERGFNENHVTISRDYKKLGLSGFPNKTRGSSGVCRG